MCVFVRNFSIFLFLCYFSPFKSDVYFSLFANLGGKNRAENRLIGGVFYWKGAHFRCFCSVFKQFLPLKDKYSSFTSKNSTTFATVNERYTKVLVQVLTTKLLKLWIAFLELQK